MPTPNYGLPIYGDDDTSELDVLLNGQSSAVDAALVALRREAGASVNSQSARNALFPSPVHGDHVFRTDLGYVQRYYNDTTQFPATGWMRDGGDSGWRTPSLINSFGQGSSASRYRRIGPNVFLAGGVTRSTSPGGQLNAFILPVGYRPTTTFWASGRGGTEIVVETNGEVSIIANGALSGVGWTLGHINFPEATS
jgi:hypothetical protein